MLYLYALGAVVLAATLTDAIWTALSPGKGAGPLTGPLNRWLWRAAHRVVPGYRDSTLVWIGPVLLVFTAFMWTVLLITGWTLVFSAQPSSLMNTRTNPPVPSTLTGRIWFVTYTMFTVGNGDFTPGGSGYQIAASFVAITGMSLITAALSYVVSLASAVATVRGFASSVFSLGSTAPEVVCNAWNGSDAAQLGSQLSTFGSQLSSITEQHRAYPLMHFYHAPRATVSVERALGLLKDLLLLLETLPEEARPAPIARRAVSAAVSQHLKLAGNVYLIDKGHPPDPSLQPLREAGIPLPDANRLPGLLEEHAKERSQLYSLVFQNGWDWPTH